MNALKHLLDDLEAIGLEHMEVEDTDVREQMYAAVYHGFIEQTPGYALPETFGMFEAEGDAAVRDALIRFLDAARREAQRLGLAAPAQRFRAFENGEILSDGGKPYDDFFGSAETYEQVKAAFGR
jgi:hypothetical protein